MAKSRAWTVLPHRPIEKVEDNLWLVDGDLPRGAMNRRMAIIRLADGSLVFHNAIPLDDASMRAVEAFGKPSILLVPNGYHRLDVHPFKARFPGMRVLCPAPIHAKVSEKVEVDGTYDAFPSDPDVRIESIDGLKNGEGAVVVKSGPRVSLIFADVVMNIPHLPGFEGFVLRVLGSTGGPKVTGIAKMAIVKDKRALAANLEKLSALPGLFRLSVSHGHDVTGNATAVLKQVATGLR